MKDTKLNEMRTNKKIIYFFDYLTVWISTVYRPFFVMAVLYIITTINEKIAEPMSNLSLRIICILSLVYILTGAWELIKFAFLSGDK